METDKILRDLEEILETDETIESNMILEEIEEWDSIAKLTLMAYAKKEFKKNISAGDIRKFVCVQDIIDALQ